MFDLVKTVVKGVATGVVGICAVTGAGYITALLVDDEFYNGTAKALRKALAKYGE